MHMLVVGLNHRTAPVEIREKFTFSEEDLPRALQMLANTKSIMECVIVSTCNRTEIYAVVDRLHMCGFYIRDFIERWFQIPHTEFTKYLNIQEDDAVIDHLFHVTCGLDSMVIGETQILGQVRNAFLMAQQQQTTGTLFNTLFKQAVTVAKRAHSETSIGENAVSVSYAAVELGKRIFGDFKNKTVMIIGAGKMSELTVKHLRANGAEQVVVANRTLTKAEELADLFNGTARSLEHLEESLRDVDIIISSTGSSGYVLTRSLVEAAMHSRKSKPMFMIDIAVPRDLDPAISDVNNVYLYDIDDLQHIVQGNLELRQKEALKIEGMIEQEIAAFHQWFKTLGVSPVIRALQEKASSIHKETMESLFNKLPHLSERDAKVIRKLSKSLLNQMLHDPILRIKELSAERDGDEALKLFTDIFLLDGLLEQEETTKTNMPHLSDRPIKEKSRASEKPVLKTLEIMART